MSTESSHSMQAELQSVQKASRDLSRAIGQAKLAGQAITPLVEQKKLLSIRERELQRLLAGASPEPTPRPLEPLNDVVAPGKPSSDPPDVSAPTVSHPPDVSLASASDWSDWDSYVQRHANASVYHLSGWRAVIEQSFGHECPYLVARRDNRIVGVMPLVRMNSRLFGHFMVSLPYFNYGGPLTNDLPADQALTSKAIDLARAAGCRHIEWRESSRRPDLPARTEKVNMWLDLPAEVETLWQQLGSKLRAQIRKAQVAGLNYETGGVDLLDDFYRVFSVNMRDLGTPVYGKRFFEAVLRQAPGHPVLVVGRTADGKAVSAALLLRHGSRMEVPWASTLRQANALNANMGLYWHMLSYACEASCTVFDFGRSTKDAATYRFKKQWGAQPVESCWNYWLPEDGELPKLNPGNPKYRAAIAIWKRMPLFITQLLGPNIVKSLP